MPIIQLRNTSNNSVLVQNNKIDQAIYEAEKEVREGMQPISASEAKKMLDHEYYNLTTN